MIKNKFKIIALAATCVISLTGCKIKYETDTNKETSVEETSSKQESIVAPEGASIKVRYSDESFTAYLEKCKSEYEKEKGVNIQLELVSTDNYLLSINNDSTSGEDISDVYLINNSELGTAYLAGLASKVPGGVADNFDEVAIDACSYNENLVAYPLSYKTVFLAYNSDFVTENKDYTFEAIKTYSDNADFSSFEEPVTVENIFLCNLTDLFLNYGYLGDSVNIGGKYGCDQAEFSVCNEASISAVGSYIELIDYFSLNKEVTYEDVLNNFIQGKSIFTILSTSSMGTLEAAETNFVCKEFPNYDGKEKTAPLSVTTGAVVNPFSTNIELANDFANFISVSMADNLYDMTKLLPAYKAAKVNTGVYNGIYESYLKSNSKNKLRYGEQVYPLIEIALHNIVTGEDIKTELQSVDAYMKKQLEE